jgi:hypothetical protein
MVHAARSIAALRMRGQVWLLVHFPGVQVWKHAIAAIFEDECLAAVADNDPVAGADLDLVHLETLLDSFRNFSGLIPWVKQQRPQHFARDQTWRVPPRARMRRLSPAG